MRRQTIALGLVTTIFLAAPAPAADVLYLDLSGIDQMTFLSEADRELLKELILVDVQGNFDAALGEGEVIVTTDPSVPAKRTARVHNSWGRHPKPGGGTAPHYGKWDPNSAEVDVYLKNFYRGAAGPTGTACTASGTCWRWRTGSAVSLPTSWPIRTAWATTETRGIRTGCRKTR